MSSSTSFAIIYSSVLLTTIIYKSFSQNWEKVTEGRMRAVGRYTFVFGIQY